VIPNALMMRSGKIAQGAIGELVANVFGAILSIYMAFHGYGVWSLVAQMLCIFGLRMVILNVLFPIIPRFEFSLKSLAGHWTVSGAIMGSRLLELASRIAENTFVSRLLGGVSLGTYGYANQIGRFFSDAIANPVWANLYYVAINARDEDISPHYVRFHRIVSMFLFPSSILLALALPTIIPDLLGPKWLPAIEPMIALLLTYPFVSMANFYGAVMFARNKSMIVLGGTFGYLIARMLVVALCYRGGVLGMAIGLSIVNIGYYFWVVLFVSKFVGHSVSEFVKAVAGPLAASVIMGVGAYLLLGDAGSLVWLAFVGAISCVAYVLLLLAIDDRFKNDLDMGLKLLRKSPTS
jgi:PST family polysaccharide transporter